MLDDAGTTSDQQQQNWTMAIRGHEFAIHARVNRVQMQNRTTTMSDSLHAYNVQHDSIAVPMRIASHAMIHDVIHDDCVTRNDAAIQTANWRRSQSVASPDAWIQLSATRASIPKSQRIPTSRRRRPEKFQTAHLQLPQCDEDVVFDPAVRENGAASVDWAMRNDAMESRDEQWAQL